MEGEWSCYGMSSIKKGNGCYKGDLYNGGGMVIRGVVSLTEGEWSCYGGGQFKGERMVMLQR